MWLTYMLMLLICELIWAIQYPGNYTFSGCGGSSYLVTCTDGGHELVVDLIKKNMYK